MMDQLLAFRKAGERLRTGCGYNEDGNEVLILGIPDHSLRYQDKHPKRQSINYKMEVEFEGHCWTKSLSLSFTTTLRAFVDLPSQGLCPELFLFYLKLVTKSKARIEDV
jgi:hypothetical protein